MVNVRYQKDRMLTGRKRYRPARERAGFFKRNSATIFVVQVEESYRDRLRWRDATLEDFSNGETFLGPTL